MTEINKYLQGTIAPITTNSSQEQEEVMKILLEAPNAYILKDEESPLFIEGKGVVWVSKREIIKSMLPDLVELISACFWIGVICLLKPFALVDKTLRKQLK